MNLYAVNKPICNADYKKVCDNEKMLDKYSDRLNYALNRREMSQSELARRVGVKPQAIQYLCREGTKSVHSVKIAEALGISAKWLTDGIGDMELHAHDSDAGLPIYGDLSSLIPIASPRTQVILQTLEKAEKEGRLTDNDIKLLTSITERLLNDKDRKNS